ISVWRGTTLINDVGSTGIGLNTAWVRIEWKVDTSTNPDTYELRVNGITVASGSLGNDVTTGLVEQWLGKTTNRNNQAPDEYFDDWAVTDGLWPGDGGIIARQGIEGPLTDNAWNKASGPCTLAPNYTYAGTLSDN